MSSLSCAVLHCYSQNPHTAFARAAKLEPDAAPPSNCAAAAAAAADQLPKGSACGCRLMSGELPAAAALGDGSELDRRAEAAVEVEAVELEAVAVAGGSGRAVVGTM